MENGTPTTAAAAKRKLRWYQYSLRTLLIGVTLFGFACSWFVVRKIIKARVQKEAVEALVKLGASVKYDYERFAGNDFNPEPEPTTSQLMRLTFGNDSVGTAEDVEALDDKVTDADLRLLQGMHQLRFSLPRQRQDYGRRIGRYWGTQTT